jgi:HEAT repeat protein
VNTQLAFRLGLVIISTAILAMALTIVVTKAARQIRARRLSDAAREVRPLVLAALDSGEGLPDLTPRGRRAAQAIIVSLLPKLRGSDRTSLAHLLADNGVLERAVSDLSSRSAVRRGRAAELIGLVGHTDAEPGLIRRLDDRDAGVRMFAARALGRLGQPGSVVALFDGMARRRVPANTASMAVLRIGASGAPGILAATDSSSPLTRSVAAELAGALGLHEARERLEAMLDDSDEMVRAGAARALGRLAAPSSSPVIVERLERLLGTDAADRNDEVVRAMIEALGRIGHRLAIPVLEASLTCHPRLSSAAGESLAAMGQRRSRRSNRHRGTHDEPTALEPAASALESSVT